MRKRSIVMGLGVLASLGVCDVLESHVALAVPVGGGGSGGGCSDVISQVLVVGHQKSTFDAPGNTELSLLAVEHMPVHLAVTETSYSVKPCNSTGTRKTTVPFVWKLDVPAGSQATLDNPASATPSFTPDKIGDYTAHLIGCPAGCKVRLRSVVGTKIMFEDETIGPKDWSVKIPVATGGQIPPLFTPSNLNDPRSPFKGTEHQHFDVARNACSDLGKVGIALGAPEWFTTTTWTTPTPPYRLAEGRVYKSQVAGQDAPQTHIANDHNANLELDPPFRDLLVDDSPEDIGPLLPFGGIEVEWEFLSFPEVFRPIEGDRMSVLGFHIVDCGHTIHSEIHPPIASAVHRPRAVKLPAQYQYAQRGGQPVGSPQPIGTNVYVPGIVSDIWVSLNAGEVVEAGRGLHQPRTVTCGQTACYVPVGPPTTAGQKFRFHVYLPPSPTFLLRQVITPAFDPALFVQVVDHPQGAALGASNNLPVREVERVLDGPYPYLTYEIDLSSLSAGQKFAKRIEAAWVYPDLEGKNFGLHAYKVRLKQMKVTETGDFTNGDWKLWVTTPSLDAPWTKLVDCHSCVDSTTYAPNAGIWQPGALDAAGGLRGDVLLFQPPNTQFLASQVGHMKFTGYDEDLEFSDGIGALDVTVNRVEDLQQSTQCDPNNPSETDCPSFTASYSVTPGTTPIAEALDPAARAGFQGLLIHPRIVDAANRFRPVEAELYSSNVTARRRKVVLERKEDEAAVLKKQLEPTTLKADIQKAPPKVQEEFLTTLRKRTIYVLGPNPTPAHRAKVGKSLRAMKPSIPADLYKKYLCDLETGTTCK